MSRPQRTVRLLRPAAAIALLAAVGACSSGTAGPDTGPAPTASSASSPAATPTPSAEAGATAGASGPGEPAPPVPGAHVHGLAVDADGTVLVATHEGLLRYGADGPVQVGPTVDLMGFSQGPDRLYASGHAGPGSGLPEPLGLVESTDGGATWSVVSRGGQSDFHALTASSAGVLGFDGAGLWSSADGREWERREVPVQPYALAAAPDGSVVLATTVEGPLRSADGGRTWEGPGSPLLQLVAWAGGTAVGVAPDGAVAVSEDGGVTWQPRGTIGGPPEGLAAATGTDGVRVVAVTGGRLVESLDGGATFGPLLLP